MTGFANIGFNNNNHKKIKVWSFFEITSWVQHSSTLVVNTVGHTISDREEEQSKPVYKVLGQTEIRSLPIFSFWFHAMLTLTVSRILFHPHVSALTSWFVAFLKSFELTSVVFIHWCVANTPKLRGIQQHSIAYTSVGQLVWLSSLCFSFFWQEQPHRACHSHCDDREAREQVYFEPMLNSHPVTAHWPNQISQPRPTSMRHGIILSPQEEGEVSKYLLINVQSILLTKPVKQAIWNYTI